MNVSFDLIKLSVTSVLGIGWDSNHVHSLTFFDCLTNIIVIAIRQNICVCIVAELCTCDILTIISPELLLV